MKQLGVSQGFQVFQAGHNPTGWMGENRIRRLVDRVILSTLPTRTIEKNFNPVNKAQNIHPGLERSVASKPVPLPIDDLPASVRGTKNLALKRYLLVSPSMRGSTRKEINGKHDAVAQCPVFRRRNNPGMVWP